MKILVIYNATDLRCGFRNFGDQTITALRRAGVQAFAWDGTYTTVCGRRGNRDDQTPDGFFPRNVNDFDVVHTIWHAATLNHYSGAHWETVIAPVRSWWNGGPADASCPFESWMQVRWSEYPRDGYFHVDYPVPDWVDRRPPPDAPFTVGTSSVRGDGVEEITDICTRHGWALNASAGAGDWLSIEDEVRRLARSSVNVCWYHTPAVYATQRASAPAMMLASGRPLLINQDPLLRAFHTAPDLYHAQELEPALVELATRWAEGDTLRLPTWTADTLSWSRAADYMIQVWKREAP